VISGFRERKSVADFAHTACLQALSLQGRR
jgi:hypothetical protein